MALDMDGTTLSSRHVLTPRTISALHKVDAAGIQVIIATGRPTNALQRFIDEMGFEKKLPAVCFNGACAILMQAKAPSGNEVVLTRGLTEQVTQSALRICREQGLVASFSYPDGSVAVPADERQERLLSTFEALEGVKQRRVADLEEHVKLAGPPLKVIAISETPEASAREALAALPHNTAHIFSAECHIEFLSPGVSKGDTLALLCKTLGIPLDAVMAFGDNHNDKEMLSLVGEGVAMKNANDAVKAVAARTCQWSNDEEGVARELEALLL